MSTESKIKEIIRSRGEFDGVCKLIYFNTDFNNFTGDLDLIAGYYNEATDGLCFSLMDKNDRIADYALFDSFSNEQKDKIWGYVEFYPDYFYK